MRLLSFWVALVGCIALLHVRNRRIDPVGDGEVALVVFIDPSIMAFGLAVTAAVRGWVPAVWGIPAVAVLGGIFFWVSTKRRGGPWLTFSIMFMVGAITLIVIRGATVVIHSLTT